MATPLTADNFRSGFLVDDEVIAGVTEIGEGGTPVFAAYVSHYLTGETYAYREFAAPEPALEFLAAIDRPWTYEAVGCSSKKTSGGGSSCGAGSCGSGGCKTC